MNAMHIVIVNDFAHTIGGASKVAIESAKELQRRGYTVHFFAGVGPVDDDLASSGVKVHCLDSAPYNQLGVRAGLTRGVWDREAHKAFADLLDTLDPGQTVVHLHTNRDALSASVPETALKKNFSVVLTAHEFFLGCPYGAFFDERKNQRCMLRGLSAECLLTHCNPGPFVRKGFAVLKGFQHLSSGIPGKLKDIIFVSDFSEHILKTYINPTTNKHRVDNPVVKNRVERRPFPTTSRFLVIGNLHPGKNPVTIAAAAKIAGLEVRFAGVGHLEKDILSANPEAVLLGWQTPEQLATELRKTSAVVFCPIWPETQGLAVYEAASHGIPSIVARTCAARDLVENSKAGMLVDPHNADEIADAMKTIAAPERNEADSTKLYDSFWQNPPTLEKHVAKLTDVYKGILDRRKT